MRSADQRDIANARLAGRVCPHLGRTLRRLVLVILFVTLATISGTGPARAECSQLCLAQTAEQEQLLAPFTALLGTAAGRDALAANFQTQDYIYLNSTQAQKIAAGTVFILGPGAAAFPVLQANLLLRAFPGNPAYGFDPTGVPTAPPSRRRSPRRWPTSWQLADNRDEAVFRHGADSMAMPTVVAWAVRFARQSTALPGVRRDLQ